jgi:serine/threonine protein kinase
MRDIKENLLWMHNYHIIHRDVKLSNCMLNPRTDKFVLVDFGISQPVNENHQTPTHTAYCGTLEYMTN